MTSRTQQQSGKVTIIGGGPIGLTMALLSAKHLDTTIVTNRPISLPITFEGSVTGELRTPALKCLLFENYVPLSDEPIILAVKSYDLHKTLKDISPSLSSNTPIILIQNGLSIFLDASEILSRKIPYVRALLYFGARSASPNTIVVDGTPKAVLAAPEYAKEVLQHVASLLTFLGFEITLHSNVAHAEWEKALVSLSVVPVATSLSESNDIVLRNAKAKSEVLLLLSEVREIAKSEGFFNLFPNDEELILSVARYGKNRNSLLLDLERGQDSELDATLGRALRIAEANNIRAPRLAYYYQLLSK